MFDSASTTLAAEERPEPHVQSTGKAGARPVLRTTALRLGKTAYLAEAILSGCRAVFLQGTLFKNVALFMLHR